MVSGGNVDDTRDVREMEGSTLKAGKRLGFVVIVVAVDNNDVLRCTDVSGLVVNFERGKKKT